MKIIDCRIKGNAIRLYLGKDDLKDWYGDDWNDRGCEDRVYDEFIKSTVDINIDFKDTVFTMFNFDENEVSKDMLKNKAYPMLIICHNTDVGDKEESCMIYNYRTAMEWKDKTVIYMGDKFKGVCELEEGNNKS